MAATSHLSEGSIPARRISIQRWRRRSRVIRGLRILLPGLIVAIVAGLAGSIAHSTLTAQPSVATSSDDPIKLINPRFVGRDDRGRAFALTAASATRDPRDYQKVFLDKPALILDAEGPDPLHITGGAGVYHEGTRKLEVSGGVRLSGARAAFETATSLFDTKTGELAGPGPVHGSGSLGEIDAKSYAVDSKQGRMIFRGGVHTRMESK